MKKERVVKIFAMPSPLYYTLCTGTRILSNSKTPTNHKLTNLNDADKRLIIVNIITDQIYNITNQSTAGSVVMMHCM